MTRRPRSSSAPLLVAAAAIIAASMLTGCTSSTPSAGPTSSSGSSASSAPSGPTTTVASSYADIATLAKALNDHGVTCQLSYPGLKDDASQAELSICTIDDEQAFLRVWKDPALVQKFLASPDGQTGTVAVGTNWMISLQSPAVAAKVASSIGGSAPGVSAGTPGSTP